MVLGLEAIKAINERVQAKHDKKASALHTEILEILCDFQKELLFPKKTASVCEYADRIMGVFNNEG